MLHSPRDSSLSQYRYKLKGADLVWHKAELPNYNTMGCLTAGSYHHYLLCRHICWEVRIVVQKGLVRC